jgi:hypothetical protein
MNHFRRLTTAFPLATALIALLSPACATDEDDDAASPDPTPIECRRSDASANHEPDAGASAPIDAAVSGGRLSAPARIELLAVGVEKYRGKAVATDRQRRGDAVRVTFDPESGPLCLRGAEYAAFYVDRGSRNTVLLLEGGGACWSGLCAAEETADEQVRAVATALDDPSNPFRDWNLVFAPYCDGSVFWGDHDLSEEDGRPRHHRGQQNLAAALDLAREHFADSQRVLVSGFSAGAYGTLRAMLSARLMFPGAELSVLADSGAGMQNPLQSTAIEQRLAEWGFAATIPGSCSACEQGRGHQSAMFSWLLERDPSVRIAFLSYYEDPVIGQAFNGLDGPGYKALLLEQTDPIAAAYPDRFKRFMLPGNKHVVMFDLPAVSADGVKLADWLTAFANDDGDGWQDVLADGP